MQSFYFLESISRVPYFSFMNVIHLHESFGWWRASELRKIHFAQEWNKFHHLLIIKSLGGSVEWKDRFVTSHAVLIYFWVLVALYMVDPEEAYNFA